MNTADKTLVVKEYDAVHAFANPSNPNHDVTASKDAFNESVKFLNKRFFQKGG
jgi:carboxymethylenebutenolidase